MGGQLRLKLESAADFGRVRFIVSACNAEAADALDRWPDGRSQALALIGPAGSGKTHLATAWAARTGAVVLHKEAMDQEPDHWPSGPAVLEDADGAAHGEVFFHLLNSAERPGGALLLTGRSAPNTWPVAVPDLRSRLNALPVVVLGEPDDAVLRGVLINLFQERSIRAPDDLLAYLVRRMERSAAAARAMVRALDEASSAESRPVSRVLARQILKDESEDEGPD